MKPIRLVCATKYNPEAFKKSLLGTSLLRLKDISASVAYNNREGLGTVYNRFLTEQYRNEILVFIHDDIFIDDYWIDVRLNEAIEKYDVIGLTGLSYLISAPNWDGISPWDCGTVAEPNPSRLWRERNRAPHAVYSVDGQCIAINAEKILSAGIRWDERFVFEFYDIDFCRQCVTRGLSIGVWPLALTHGGKGRFGSPEFMRSLGLFNRKWNL